MVTREDSRLIELATKSEEWSERQLKNDPQQILIKLSSTFLDVSITSIIEHHSNSDGQVCVMFIYVSGTQSVNMPLLTGAVP